MWLFGVDFAGGGSCLAMGFPAVRRDVLVCRGFCAEYVRVFGSCHQREGKRAQKPHSCSSYFL